MVVFTQFTPELQTAWNTVLAKETHHFPFYTFAWHDTWYSLLAQKERLCTLADMNRSLVLPLAIKDGVAHFTGGEEISDYLDAIGNTEQKAAVWKEVLSTLKEQGATSLVLRNIPEDSPSLTYFRSLADARVEQEDTTPIAILPDTFDAYLASLDRKNRHELKRKIRKFEESYEGITSSVVSGPSVDIASLLRLMRLDEDKRIFLTPDMERFFTALPEIVGPSLWQIRLHRDAQLLATTVAFLSGSTLLLYNSGFVRDYIGAGFYLKAKTIQWAIDQHVTTYNFLQGNERYKYELGGKDFFVYRVHVSL